MAGPAIRNKVSPYLAGTPCAWCREKLETGDNAAICDACATSHHESCFDEYGGCGKYGCIHAAPNATFAPSFGFSSDAPPITDIPPRVVLHNEGLTKPYDWLNKGKFTPTPPTAVNSDEPQVLQSYQMHCPHCNAIITKNVDQCPNCRRFTTPDGMYHGPTYMSPDARNAIIAAVVSLFIFGIILGPLAIRWARKAKETIPFDYHLRGEGLAQAAEIIAWIAIVLWAIGTCARLINLT